MKHLALAAKASRGGARKAGYASGKSRRKWESHALELAKRITEENPNLSQVALAESIRDAWSKVDKRPGSKSLISFLSLAEDSGQIHRVRRKKTHR
jgi:hypothetical protein